MKADQKRIVKMPKDEQREVIVRQIRKTKASKEADDRRARDILLFKRPVINRVTWSSYGSPYFSWLDDQKDAGAEAEDQG